MCWKSHVQEPEPRPTVMPVVFSTAADSQNIANTTLGDRICPDQATVCSNITSSTFEECDHGFCCERNGDTICSCMTGWKGSSCDIQEFDSLASIYNVSSTHQWLIAVLIGALLVGILIIVFVVYRKRKSQNNSNQHREQESLANISTPSSTKVNEGTCEPTTPLKKEQNVNGNDKGAS